MRAGLLRHSVEVQSAFEVKDDRSSTRKIWTTLEQRRASVSPAGGSERVEADQQTARATHEVRMRDYPGLTPAHRLVHEGRPLNIESVTDVDERGVEAVVAHVVLVGPEAEVRPTLHPQPELGGQAGGHGLLSPHR